MVKTINLYPEAEQGFDTIYKLYCEDIQQKGFDVTPKITEVASMIIKKYGREKYGILYGKEKLGTD